MSQDWSTAAYSTAANYLEQVVEHTREALSQASDFAHGSLQKQIDVISEKAKQGKKLSILDEAFLVKLYQAIVIGGLLKGYGEAAILLNHYLFRSGELLEIPSGIYENSDVVMAEVSRQKKTIKVRLKARKDLSLVSKLLFADNERLKKADNRFYLKSYTVLLPNNGGYKTEFRVENRYDFTGFDTGYYTDLTAFGQTIKLPDGLSKHLHTIGLAKEFDYYATWEEDWQ